MFKHASFTSLAQSFGSIGIALSLLLVAFELKQSRDIAEAQLCAPSKHEGPKGLIH